MVRVFYPTLPIQEKLRVPLAEIQAKTFELSEFLVNVLGVKDIGATFSGRITYHDSCHLLRELKIKDPPRILLQNVRGAELVEMEEAEACCGFGGSFSMKFPEISTAMLEQKVISIQKTGAEHVIANDAGCLMQIGGLLHRQRIPVKVLHLADFLSQGIAA